MRVIISLLIFGNICFAQCDKITKSVDKFTSQISIIGMDVQYSPFAFNKIIKGTDTLLFVYANIFDGYMSIGQKGFYILFSDSTKIEFPEKEIKIEVNEFSGGKSDQYEYSAYKRISQYQFLMFIDKTITDIKLGIFTKQISKKESNTSSELAKCVLLSK